MKRKCLHMKGSSKEKPTARPQKPLLFSKKCGKVAGFQRPSAHNLFVPAEKRWSRPPSGKSWWRGKKRKGEKKIPSSNPIHHPPTLVRLSLFCCSFRWLPSEQRRWAFEKNRNESLNPLLCASPHVAAASRR